MSSPARAAWHWTRPVLVMMALAVAAMPVAAQPTTTGDDVEWVEQLFDFGSDDLNFTATIPAGSDVQTIDMPAREEGTAGRIVIVGKILPGQSTAPVEGTIVALDLATPSAATLVCVDEVETVNGHTIRQRSSVPDLSEARYFATRSQDGRPASGLFTYCAARGHKMLVMHFVADVSDTESEAEADARVAAASDYFGQFLNSLEFSDGIDSGYRDRMTEIPVVVDGERTTLRVPDRFDIAINDFDGRFTAELHLAQKDVNGNTAGLLWFAARNEPQKPDDLAAVGEATISAYLVQQSPDFAAPQFQASNAMTFFDEAGASAQMLHFSGRNRAGEPLGEGMASVIWHEGRLYVISLWAHWDEVQGRDAFFARSPGLTAYELVAGHLLREVLLKK